MKIHTTNYQHTFIEVAEDCPVNQGEQPPSRGDKKTVANWQYEMLVNHPYHFTSDEVLFQIYAERNDLTEEALEAAHSQFFSKGQPCFRSSPLTKRYGWGVHYDAEGKMALYGMQSEAYQRFSEDPDLKVVKAMRSKRKG